MFRGCAGAHFPHDQKCDRELQSVQVVAGKKSVDVEVLLCYCNSDTCNEKISGAAAVAATAALTAASALLAKIMA